MLHEKKTLRTARLEFLAICPKRELGCWNSPYFDTLSWISETLRTLYYYYLQIEFDKLSIVTRVAWRFRDMHMPVFGLHFFTSHPARLKSSTTPQIPVQRIIEKEVCRLLHAPFALHRQVAQSSYKFEGSIALPSYVQTKTEENCFVIVT